MTRANRLAKEIQTISKVLSKDPETQDRYASATNRGKRWLCFSAWLANNRERWQDREAAECRDRIANRLSSTDITYVLQFETDIDVVAYLKAKLIAAANRETTPMQLAKRADWLSNARRRWSDFTANVPTESESWTGRKIQIGNCFYSKMMPIKEALSKDTDTKQQYEFARRGGREWFCFSWWIAEDRTRWNDRDAVEYRDSLVSWLGSIDIAYVLQFERKVDVIAYLKSKLISAVDRETTKWRLNRKASIMGTGLHNPWYKEYGRKKTTDELAKSTGCGMICRLYSAMKGYANYLRGNSPGPSFWTHPDCRLYLEWHNKYDAPTSGLLRVQ